MEYNLPPYRTELPRYQPGQDDEEKARLQPPRPSVNVILFVLTVGTTLLAGSFLEGGNPFLRFPDLLLGIPFAFTLLAIIGCHEFGHYFMCRKHGVAATLPYFIPVPPPFFLIGTLGAVIKIRSPILNNRALFDIGAAGPIAGLIVAIPAIFIGLNLSEVREVMPSVFSLGDPIIMKLASRIVFGEIPAGFDVYISSIAFAGWVGLIVTAFNLLPIGQLDGGHIAYALMGRHQTLLGYVMFILLFPLALYWSGWFIFIIIALLMKIPHPSGAITMQPLGTKRKILGIVCLIIFIISFIPVPFRGAGIIHMFSAFFQ